MESEGCYIGRSWSTRGDARSSVFLRSARSRPCSGSKALTRAAEVSHVCAPRKCSDRRQTRNGSAVILLSLGLIRLMTRADSE